MGFENMSVGAQPQKEKTTTQESEIKEPESEAINNVTEYKKAQEGLLDGLKGKALKVAKAMMVITALSGTIACESKNTTENASGGAVNTSVETQQARRSRMIELVKQRRLLRQKQYEQRRREEKVDIDKIKNLSKEMGVSFNQYDYKFHYKKEGGVITSINGNNVPENLLTEDEIKRIELARGARKIIDSTNIGEMEENIKSFEYNNTKRKEKAEHNDVLESAPIDTSAY